MLEVVCEVLCRLPTAQVVGERTVLAALSRLETEAFDLLVTDLRVPPTSGLKLIERARELRPGMQVVAITGYPTAQNAQRCRELGTAAYLRKPFDPLALLALVERLLTPPEAP